MRTRPPSISIDYLIYRILIIATVLAARVTVAQVQPVDVFHGDTAKCYSCMSRLYAAVWPQLSTLYKAPKNFTDACDDLDAFPGEVRVVHCPTICISMSESMNIGGVIVKGNIRGCMADVLINGFNQTIVSWYRWLHRDSCKMYRKKDLFKLEQQALVDDSSIEVCTCYDDHCNGRNASTNVPSSMTSLLLLLLTVLLLYRLP